MQNEQPDVTRSPAATPSSGQASAGLRAEDVMQQKLVTLDPGDSLATAERVLTEASISGAPVVDATGQLLGVVSLRDLVRHRSEDLDLPPGVAAVVFDDEVGDTEVVRFTRPEDGACVGNVMTQEVLSVTRNTPVTEIAARMVESNVHRLLVVERGRLLGLVSSLDALGAFARTV